LLQVLVQWVVFHTLVLDLVLEQLLEVSMEPEERVGRSAFLFILLEIGIFLWVSPVIWVLAGTSSSTTTCWWCSRLSVGTFGVLLLDVRVESWIAEISLDAIVTFKVASFNIVL